MRSYLTRRIFRQILHNEIYSVDRSWLRPTRSCLRAQYLAVLPKTSKRSLFGFSRKAKRQPKPINYDPGYQTMLELDNRLKTGIRPQPSEELAQAFNDFFRSKHKHSQPLEDIQAKQALVTFEHLQRTGNDGEGYRLSSEEMTLALRMLGFMSKEYKAHTELAKALFTELQRTREACKDDAERNVGQAQELAPFILVLSQSGNTLHARDLVEQYWDRCLKDSRTSPWATILRGFIREKKSNELQKTVDIMEKFEIPFDAKIHQVITTYFAYQEENIEMTKSWYSHPIASGKSPTAHTDAMVLKLCIKKNELEWGENVFTFLLNRGAEDMASWNIIFQWAAAKGKSVDEIERMMQVMVNRSQEKGKNLHPDTETMNGLIWLANSKNDPYTAERYLALGQKLNIQPNARTYLLQLDYRLKVGDLGGARTAYARLQGEEVPDQEDLSLINKLIVALCNQKPLNYDAVMSLVEDLSERKVRFEHETVGALSQIHLHRDEMDDLIDLLNTHAFYYGLDQRASVRDVLLKYCLDPSTSISGAWSTYNILRQTFAETDVPIRTTIMNSFFERGRSDMATHVFGHMRQQQIKSLRPGVATYAQCLSGLGRAGDAESLGLVHNMIKLDNEIEPNTQLHNALMLAYSGCGNPSRALQFWEDIVHSREGPSYASIQIALQTCEKLSSGDTEAKDIWSQLRRFDIEVTREIYAAYVGALAGQNLFDECVGLINSAEKDIGYMPDALL